MARREQPGVGQIRSQGRVVFHHWHMDMVAATRQHGLYGPFGLQQWSVAAHQGLDGGDAIDRPRIWVEAEAQDDG